MAAEVTVGVILGFDFGERHTGVAVGDMDTGLAHPLTVIEARRAGERLERIAPLVAEWQPARFVVGLPVSMDGAMEGGEHPLAARVRRFGRSLEAQFRRPVEYADERLSSVEAGETLRTAGRGGREHKHLVHPLAARIILQDWLDRARRVAAPSLQTPPQAATPQDNPEPAHVARR